MIGQGLRQLQETLNRKADAIQHEFIATSEKLQRLSRQLLEAHGEERTPIEAEQAALHEQQQALAGDINLWRERAREAVRQQGEAALRAYLAELQATGDETVRQAVDQVLYLIDATEEELAKLSQSQARARPTTPAGRLIERARTEFDLRGKDPAPRQKAASEFANRSGMAQNDDALAELEAAAGDKDALVSELVLLTLIQMHRFRAMRLADLDAVHRSVERLTQLKHPAVIPVLIEVAANPRTGYVEAEHGMVEGSNARSREAALNRLAEWHTAEAYAAVQARQFDRDRHIVEVAARLLEAQPGPWK